MNPPLSHPAVGVIAERIGAPLATAGACVVALVGIGLIARHYRLLQPSSAGRRCRGRR